MFITAVTAGYSTITSFHLTLSTLIISFSLFSFLVLHLNRKQASEWPGLTSGGDRKIFLYKQVFREVPLNLFSLHAEICINCSSYSRADRQTPCHKVSHWNLNKLPSLLLYWTTDPLIRLYAIMKRSKWNTALKRQTVVICHMWNQSSNWGLCWAPQSEDNI